MTNIFEYSNIFLFEYLFGYSFVPFLDTNIFGYSEIRIFQFGYSCQKTSYIQIYLDICSCHFLDTNIFGYSFVSKSIRMSHSVLGTLGYFEVLLGTLRYFGVL